MIYNLFIYNIRYSNLEYDRKSSYFKFLNIAILLKITNINNSWLQQNSLAKPLQLSQFEIRKFFVH